MEKEEIEENLIRGYIYLNARLFKKKYYRYDVGVKNAKLVSNYLSALLLKTKASPTSITLDYLKTMLLFSFYRNANYSETHYRDKKMIPLNVIFGMPTLMKWLQRHNYPTWESDLRENFVENLNLTFDDIFTKDFRMPHKNTRFTTLFKLEELDKKRNLNSEHGFMVCSTSTTLYYHESRYCQACFFKDICLDRLKEVYPEIYKARGYDE